MKWIKTYENFQILQGYDDHYSSIEYLKIKKIIERIEYLSKLEKEITTEEIEFLDDISGYPMLYSSIKYFIKDTFDVFKKYSIDDIKDRLLEYFDKIPKFNPFVMFSISSKSSSIGITENKLDDRKYFLSMIASILKDILWRCLSKSDVITIDEYFDIQKPSIYIDFNPSWRHTTGEKRFTYNLLFLENLADEIYKRFRELYDIDGVSYEYERMNRRYNPNMEVYSYDFKLYLK